MCTLSDSFEIKRCSSNKIHEVEWKSNERKATIRVDEKQIIGDPRTVFVDTYSDLRIWCESDNLLSKCSLEHSNGATKDMACENSLPLACTQDHESTNCKSAYKNIKAVQTSNYRCEFHFTIVTKKGKIFKYPFLYIMKYYGIS